MKIEELPSGSYRIRKTCKGKTYTLIVSDHKPSQKEAMILMGEYMNSGEEKAGGGKTFYNCAIEYINTKSNILSAATERGYRSLLNKGLSEEFTGMNIYDITQKDIQVEINRYAKDHAPKTVRNAHGLITPVFKMFRPSLNISTTLPQKVKYEPYIPSHEEVLAILDAAAGTEYHLPFRLGCLALRRSEVCALQKTDLVGNMLTINKAMIQNSDNEWIIKPLTKTTDGTRTIKLVDDLVEEFNAADRICPCVPSNLLKVLHSYQDKLGIPQFRFHDLRHFYASFAHQEGMVDADLKATGGWKSDYVMKNVYTHSMKKSKENAQIKVEEKLFSK